MAGTPMSPAFQSSVNQNNSFNKRRKLTATNLIADPVERQRAELGLFKGSPGTTNQDIAAGQKSSVPLNSATLASIRKGTQGDAATPSPNEVSPSTQGPTLKERFTPAPFQSGERQAAGEEQASSFRNALPSALTEAAIAGGAATAIGTPVAGVIVGAGAFARKLYAELKQEKKDKVAAKQVPLDKASKSLKAVINQANSGVDRDEVLELWTYKVGKIRQDWYDTQQLNRGKVLNARAEAELADFEDFFDSRLPDLEIQLAKALDNPSGEIIYDISDEE